MSDMKVVFFIIFIYFSLIGSLLSLKFISGMEDIPIYKEMKNVEDSLILFDKIDGRYVSSEIIGDYKEEEVINFYYKILPNLGWKKIHPFKFKRGNEILEISLDTVEQGISVIFSIYPGK